MREPPQMDLIEVLASVEAQVGSLAEMIRIVNALTEAVPGLIVEAQVVSVVRAVPEENVGVRVVFRDFGNQHRHQIRSMYGK